MPGFVALPNAKVTVLPKVASAQDLTHFLRFNVLHFSGHESMSDAKSPTSLLESSSSSLHV